jgi:uncharacterized membrane protein
MSYQPSPSRLEAFSDGVIAVIITIMVLELKAPRENGFAGLLTVAPTLGVYLLSFFTGIYWVNHHHLVDRLKHVDHVVLWANLIFLFFLSLLPFFTNYMAEKHIDSFSVAIYVASLLMTALSFTVLQKCVGWRMRNADRADPEEIALQAAEVRKAIISLAILILAIGLSYVHPSLGLAAAALVTVLWFMPTFGVRRTG